MSKSILYSAFCISLLVILPGCVDSDESVSVTAFASDGHLKMLYDIRMQPSAIEYDSNIYITWRGQNGLPTSHILSRSPILKTDQCA